jgi:hypothetical protein
VSANLLTLADVLYGTLAGERQFSTVSTNLPMSLPLRWDRPDATSSVVLEEKYGKK